MEQLTLNLNVKSTPKHKLKRHKLDQYDSPHWFVTHLPNYININGVIGEPCRGAGNLSSLLSCFQGCKSLWTNDINPDIDSHFHYDAADPESWKKFPSTDWIVTNPPFSEAFPILLNAYEKAKVGVIFFLRLSFIDSIEERAEWLFHHKRYVDLIYPRFKFRKGKNGNWQTDFITMGAFIWLKNNNQTLGSLTIPQSKIAGFHDNPTNAPSLQKQIEILQREELINAHKNK
ncbi:MAG TPA: hypothetical protein VK184_22975 [Nostocaceae cyanobacterium]|nr:hypothetical protein [Nostocaceae cyanobacterium]